MRGCFSDAGASYVSARPPHKRRNFPLVVGAQNVGSWEKYALIEDPKRTSRIRLLALAGKRYVTASEEGNGPLTTRSDAPGSWETFIRVDSGQAVALRASNGKYVSATGEPTRRELFANGSTIGIGEQFAIEHVRP